MTGAKSLSGGIATVNISILQSLNDLVLDNRIKLKVFSLLENDSDRPCFLHQDVKFKGFNGKNYFLLIL